MADTKKRTPAVPATQTVIATLRKDLATAQSEAAGVKNDAIKAVAELASVKLDLAGMQKRLDKAVADGHRAGQERDKASLALGPLREGHAALAAENTTLKTELVTALREVEEEEDDGRSEIVQMAFCAALEGLVAATNPARDDFGGIIAKAKEVAELAADALK